MIVIRAISTAEALSASLTNSPGNQATKGNGCKASPSLVSLHLVSHLLSLYPRVFPVLSASLSSPLSAALFTRLCSLVSHISCRKPDLFARISSLQAWHPIPHVAPISSATCSSYIVAQSQSRLSYFFRPPMLSPEPPLPYCCHRDKPFPSASHKTLYWCHFFCLCLCSSSHANWQKIDIKRPLRVDLSRF